MRYVYAITSSLLLGGAAASLAMQPPAAAQTAQNEPGAIAASAPRAGAPMSFADMVAKLQPAVVNISTTQRVQVPREQSPLEQLFGQLNGGAGTGDGKPQTREANSLGSGFLISPDGYIVTNNHVIAPAMRGATVESITVTLQDRREFTAKLVGRDPASDLAVLKITAPGPLQFVRFGDSARARVGDWVLAIGQPFGLGGTVTAGIISALHRATGQPGAYDRFIQTDAAINQGNSGGPMFNLNGDVIGINSQIFSESGGNIGIGFAIPAEEAKPVIDQLIKGQAIKRGYLGLTIGGPVDDNVAAAFGIPKGQGEIITGVQPGGPAAHAGILAGDVVTAVDGRPVNADQTLSYLAANLAPGSTARLSILRDGKPVTASVNVQVRPPEDKLASLDGADSDDDFGTSSGDGDTGKQQSSTSLGIAAQPLTPAIARSVGVDPTVQGLVIASVDPSSDAGQKGLKRGDVIIAVNSTPVRTNGAFAAAIAAAKAQGRTQVLLLVQRGRGAKGYIPLKLAS